MAKKHQYKISAKATRQRAERSWRRQYKAGLERALSAGRFGKQRQR